MRARGRDAGVAESVAPRMVQHRRRTVAKRREVLGQRRLARARRSLRCPRMLLRDLLLRLQLVRREVRAWREVVVLLHERESHDHEQHSEDRRSYCSPDNGEYQQPDDEREERGPWMREEERDDEQECERPAPALAQWDEEQRDD